MSKSAVVTGLVLVIFGIWLFLKILGEQVWWFYIYPAVVIVIGIALMWFWRSEDRIEERKD